MSLKIGEQSTPSSNELNYRSKTWFLLSTGNPFSHSCLCDPHISNLSGSLECLMSDLVVGGYKSVVWSWSQSVISRHALRPNPGQQWKAFLCIPKPFPIIGNIPISLKYCSSIEKSRKKLFSNWFSLLYLQCFLLIYLIETDVSSHSSPS